MKKAIITFAVGYAPSDIILFVQSCKKFTPESDLYIFVGNNLSEFKEVFGLDDKIHLIRFRESFIAKIVTKLILKNKSFSGVWTRLLRDMSKQNGLRSLAHLLVMPVVQFMVKRFFLIDRLLKTITHSHLMITDIRDVILMSDPFMALQRNTIITGEEPRQLGACELNSRWIKMTYNEQFLQELQHKNILCAGVTIGTRKAMSLYIQEMMEECFQQLPNIVGLLGADQAIHNKIFYQGLSGLNKHHEKNGIGIIATLHHSRLEEFEVNQTGMKNKKGKTLAVVHQYDRHPQLLPFLRASLL